MTPERQFVARKFLADRQTAYQQVFRSKPGGEAVMQDLTKFCRAHQSTFHVDPMMAARLDGRREVFLRIADHLRLTSDELWALYATGGETHG